MLSVLREFIQNRSFDFIELLSYIISTVVVVFLSLPVHEFAHAFTAVKLGDSTPEYTGRLSLNPLHHLDPIGSLLILLFGFGWAKPVEVNARNFKNPKRDMAITALAGPVSNIILAFVFYVGFKILNHFPSVVFVEYIMLIFYYIFQINISLAVFNLVPIPPLDGSRLLSAFLSDRSYYRLMQYERYFFYGIVLLMFTGVLDIPFALLTRLVYTLFDIITFWL